MKPPPEFGAIEDKRIYVGQPSPDYADLFLNPRNLERIYYSPTISVPVSYLGPDIEITDKRIRVTLHKVMVGTYPRHLMIMTRDSYSLILTPED